jgi:hypothetical protein
MQECKVLQVSNRVIRIDYFFRQIVGYCEWISRRIGPGNEVKKIRKQEEVVHLPEKTKPVFFRMKNRERLNDIEARGHSPQPMG